MKSGQLKYRIKIYKLATTTSSFGSREENHVYDREIFAGVKYVYGGKGETNDEIFHTVTLEITTRCHNHIDLTDWLEIEGVMYQIDQPPHKDLTLNKQILTVKLINE